MRGEGTVERVAGAKPDVVEVVDDNRVRVEEPDLHVACLLYTSDDADDLLRVDLGGRRFIKKKKNRSLDRISVPVWTYTHSDRLHNIPSVRTYSHDYLIGRSTRL